jgi:uncharacterized protein (TIGR03437 family)
MPSCPRTRLRDLPPLAVTYNNATGSNAAFQVVASSFGIFAQNAAGSGPGVITDANYHMITQTSAAHPGDTVILWGNGLGTSPGDDGTAPPRQLDMPNLALSLYVGGQKANVSYRGRAPQYC